MNRTKTIVAAVMLAISFGACAEMQSIAMPQDSKLVQFPYDSNNTYTVLTMPGAVTDIELVPGEKLVAFAAGDNVQWIFAKTDGHVFVKPTVENIFTSATLVTDQRTYQITLRSSPKGGRWYQRVNWTYPDILLMKQQLEDERKKESEAAMQKVALEKKIVEAQKKNEVINKSRGNPVENLNFDYEITGEAEFRPEQVFDDGNFVWIKMNRKSGVMPAVFVKGDGDNYDLITTLRDGDYIKSDRLFHEAVLKLGKSEVHIISKNYLVGSDGAKQQFIGGALPWLTNK